MSSRPGDDVTGHSRTHVEVSMHRSCLIPGAIHLESVLRSFAMARASPALTNMTARRGVRVGPAARHHTELHARGS